MPPPVRSRCWVPPLDLSAEEWKELGKVPREGAETAFLLAVYDVDLPKLTSSPVGTHINHCHDYSPSALDVAVQCDDITALDILLGAGARPELLRFSHPESSPIIAAIQAGNSFVLQRLRQHTGLGDDQDSCKRYRRMLQIAASAGQANIVVGILACGPEGCLDSPLEFRWSILHRAACSWRVEVARLLLERFTLYYQSVNIFLKTGLS